MSSTSNFNPAVAKIKMVMLTKSGDNRVWYNFLKENNLHTSRIITKMKNRFLNSPFVNSVQVLHFYDNATKELIEEHR